MKILYNLTKNDIVLILHCTFFLIIWMDKMLILVDMMIQAGKKCVNSGYKGGISGVGKVFHDQSFCQVSHQGASRSS